MQRSLQRILTVIATSLYIRKVILHVDKKGMPQAADLTDLTLLTVPSHHLTLYDKKLSYIGMELFNFHLAQIKTEFN